MADLVRGIYRHYKGNEYRVIGVSIHTETGEKCVVYERRDWDHVLWHRPVTMFLENVTVDGKSVPRFALLVEETGDSPR